MPEDECSYPEGRLDEGGVPLRWFGVPLNVRHPESVERKRGETHIIAFLNLSSITALTMFLPIGFSMSGTV